MITGTHRRNCTLHWAYLEFAIRASTSRLSKAMPPSIPASKNLIEAIRYSYDFVDAAAEFAYQLTKGDPDGDPRPDNWLRRYVDRQWTSFSLADKLGILSFSRHGVAFWHNEKQHQLFEDLRNVRNALTHPGIFGFLCVEQYSDYSGLPVSSRQTVEGKMRTPKQAVAKFVEHPEDLQRKDALKAVEIALRHAERLEQLFGRKGTYLFGRVNSRTNRPESPTEVLARMRGRYFDAHWLPT